MAARPELHRLAARLGILPSYVDTTGVTRRTSDATRQALVDALGCDGASEEAAARARAVLDADSARLVPATRVARPAEARRVAVTLPPELAGRSPLAWTVELTDEAGRRSTAAGRLRRTRGTATLALPTSPSHGYHRLRIALDGGGTPPLTAEQRLIVVPPRCVLPHERIGARRVFGLLVNLYAVESAHNWGAGDLGDLATLVDFAGAIGAAFVGVNPLHALQNRRGEISPYSPVSRLYRNPLYLDVTAVPEIAETPKVRRVLAGAAFTRALARLKTGSHVDYPGVMALKGPLLVDLHRTFAARHRDRDTPRGRAYRRYRRAAGTSLVDFATFIVLGEHAAAAAGRDWRRWRRELRDPRSPAVQSFRVAHADEIDRVMWMQFELDRQLAVVATRAGRAGLPIGVYQDVALGSDARGSDTWSFPGLFVLDGTNVGAPPDGLAPAGQNWGFPPVDPHALRRDGYRYWIGLLRSAFRHAGALRIDHVMGLFRQFWIPAGRPGSDGAYVRFPADDLLGILALESRRARALVIGEDLGTVPRGLPQRLHRAGILSTRVMLFMQNGRGAFRPASHYPRQALVAANTHDMVPLAGWTVGRDVALRRDHGQIRSRAEAVAARRERAATAAALARLLAGAGLWPAGVPADGTDPRFRRAVHAWLRRTPAALQGIALDDLTGTVEPVNLPGVDLGRHPSWSRRAGFALEALTTDPAVATALAGLARRRRTRGKRSRRP